jgi:hypothetical protein
VRPAEFSRLAFAALALRAACERSNAMNNFPFIRMMPQVTLHLTSGVRHMMDEFSFAGSGRWDRGPRCHMRLVVVGVLDQQSTIPEPPEQPVLPTPTDVPVPEPFDVPVPEPMDVPPPNPHDVPPPRPTKPEFDPKPRSIP